MRPASSDRFTRATGKSASQSAHKLNLRFHSEGDEASHDRGVNPQSGVCEQRPSARSLACARDDRICVCSSHLVAPTSRTTPLDTTGSLTKIESCPRWENFSSSSVSQLLFSDSFSGPASAQDFWANFLATFASSMAIRFFISQSSPASLSASC